jgi:phasin family protein
MFPIIDQISNLFKSFQPGNEQFISASKSMFPAINLFSSTSQNLFSGKEQFVNAIKTSIETQVLFYNTVLSSNLATVEKLLELNMSTAKVTIEESAIITRQFITAKDAQEVEALMSALPQSILTKATAYSSHLANIGSASQTELNRAAQQQFADIGLKLSGLIDQASKNMPAGSESSTATAKAVIASASAGYEQFSKNALRVTEAVANQASSAADKVSQLSAQVPDIGTNVH